MAEDLAYRKEDRGCRFWRPTAGVKNYVADLNLDAMKPTYEYLHTLNV